MTNISCRLSTEQVAKLTVKAETFSEVTIIKKTFRRREQNLKCYSLEQKLSNTGSCIIRKIFNVITWCTGNLRTLSTANGSLKVTNPNPLDRLVAGSFMTMTSASSPKPEKYSRMLSGVVCQDSPPMNILPGSFGMSSPEKADSTGLY